MKHIIRVIALLLLTVGVSMAQPFEGSIKWNMKVEITDPATKAQMEQAKKMASDPATQAKIKEMQKMLESNPQMKAQLEPMLKMMTGGDPSALIPSGMTMKLNGKNSLLSMEGGMLDKTDFLYLADKDVTYQINHSQKSYSVKQKSQYTPTEKPKVTKTSETAKILGYTCTKYLVELTSARGATTKMNYWATDEIKGIDLKTLAKQQASKDTQELVIPDIDGFPLRIETNTGQALIHMEVVDLKKGGLSASDFSLPKGYSESK